MHVINAVSLGTNIINTISHLRPFIERKVGIGFRDHVKNSAVSHAQFIDVKPRLEEVRLLPPGLNMARFGTSQTHTFALYSCCFPCSSKLREAPSSQVSELSLTYCWVKLQKLQDEYREPQDTFHLDSPLVNNLPHLLCPCIYMLVFMTHLRISCKLASSPTKKTHPSLSLRFDENIDPPTPTRGWGLTSLPVWSCRFFPPLPTTPNSRVGPGSLLLSSALIPVLSIQFRQKMHPLPS